VLDAQPDIWRPSFLSQKGHLTTNESVMLDDAIVASVAKGIITSRDEKLLGDRSDAEAVNDSMAFSMPLLLLFQIWLDVCMFEGMKFKR
jgi:hypothetical protein